MKCLVVLYVISFYAHDVVWVALRFVAAIAGSLAASPSTALFARPLYTNLSRLECPGRRGTG
ncbi:hypothetical protein IF2G_03733 [Cordyceps javanica]|nr:hypothetical protein IF2G_03733 [Cordyceps javanica]